MFGNLGLPEIILIFIVALLVFGPRRIPEIARQLGQWMAEFRRITTEIQTSFQREMYEIEKTTVASPQNSSSRTDDQDQKERVKSSEDEEKEEISVESRDIPNPEANEDEPELPGPPPIIYEDASEDLQWEEDKDE